MNQPNVKLRYIAAVLFTESVLILGFAAVVLDLDVSTMVGLGLLIGIIQIVLCLYIGRAGIYPGGW